MDGVSSAPTLQIAPREVVAVEHPMIIKNIEKGLQTFGNGKPFERVLHVDDPEGCLPLYLRHHDPMCVPILSHNSPTTNVLLKITVPRRTGKRKRGSQNPYSAIPQPSGVCGLTESTNSSTANLLRTMKDNAGQYEVEAVAEIERTHRFRGLADFHHSTTHSVFASKFEEFVLPGEVEKMRQFKFDPSRGWKPNEEFMPPPAHTNQTLPFNWGYHQNPQLSMEVNQVTGETFLIHNEKIRKTRVDYVAADVASVPQSSPHEIPDDPGAREVISRLTEALNERPVWTRRALANRIGHIKLPVKIIQVLHHVVYQFKGGPFRDAVIKYGIDPRSDQKYRNYQTLFFKIYEEAGKGSLKQWKEVHHAMSLSKSFAGKDTMTHIFDGKSMALDGKIWQLCDITDLVLRRLIDNASLREEYEPKSDGYFSNGSWAKIHAIMRTKLMAIRAHFTLADSDFQEALSVPDVHDDNKKDSNRISVPVPSIKLSESGVSQLAQNGKNENQDRQSVIKKSRPRLRDVRIDQGMGKTGKRKYHRTKPVPPQSLPGVRENAKKFPGAGEETVSERQIVQIKPHDFERGVASHIDNGVQKRESTSVEYMTAEETINWNGDGVGAVGGDVEDDEDEEGDLEEDLEEDDSEDIELEDDSNDDEGADDAEDGGRGDD